MVRLNNAIIVYIAPPTIAAAVFLGLNPPFSISLKNSMSPSMDTTKNKAATEYLFQIIAPIRTEIKIKPVLALTTISFKS